METDTRLLSSKILIIDDDMNLGMSLEELLRDHEFNTVRYLSDPREAERVFLEYQPDIILLDIRMPYLDGFQVMEGLQEHRQARFVPILVLTADADDATRLKALRSGATDFLSKPMNATEAIARINNLLQVRQLQADLENRKEFLQDKVEERTDQLKRAVEEINGMHNQLKEAYIETIYRLTRATEYKDEETADHVKRLSLYAARRCAGT